MGVPLSERNRAEHKRYKEDVEREGKSFWPYAVLHDAIMSLVVVAVIIALACIWYFTADGIEAGLLGPWYATEADPGTISRISRIVGIPTVPSTTDSGHLKIRRR